MSEKQQSQSQLAEGFMSTFNKKKGELQGNIEGLGGTTSSNISEKLTEIAGGIQGLSKSLNDAGLYLPSYSIKMRQNEIRELEKSLRDKEELLIPKKKFGFKSKPKVEIEEVKPQEDLKPQELKSSVDSNFVTIENLDGEVIEYEHERIAGADVLIRNLTECVIRLEGSPSTLRIKDVKNCKILCGPVYTSVFVDSAVDSLLFICCQQLRTHSSLNTDIYLRVRSRAIIEECKGIRFGPYSWDHPRSKELHEQTQIDFNMERYDAVDDFNWLSATQSPNWSLLPEADRISFPSK